MSLKYELSEMQELMDMALGQVARDRQVATNGDLRDAIKILVRAKAAIHAEAQAKIDKLDSAIAALDKQIVLGQKDTPEKTNARVRASLKRQELARDATLKAIRRNPSASAKKVKVNFPSWVKGRR